MKFLALILVFSVFLAVLSACAPAGSPDNPDYFESLWDTAKTSRGSSDSRSITLPIHSGGSYDFTVDWGDGTTGRVTSWDSPNRTHKYASPGKYTLKITGRIEGFSFNSREDRNKLISISSWGPLRLGNMGEYFEGAENLVGLPSSAPDLTGTTTFYEMFREADSFNQPLDSWDVSEVTNMDSMFLGADSFNQPLSSWDVSEVTNMENMFWGAESFNQPLNSWDVSKVTNMKFMFLGADSFNQPLNDWDVSKVTSMHSMFGGAESFNQNLSSWNVSLVSDCQNFAYRLSSWTLPKPRFTSCDP